ncbi:MAG: hypothetical protein WBA76_22045 [Phormidesmis sp.]
MSLSPNGHRRAAIACSAAATLLRVLAIAAAQPAQPASAQPAPNPSIPQPKRELPQAAAIKGTVSASEFNIVGLDFYATESDVFAILGPPKSREALPNSFIDEVLYFGGISVAMLGGQVWDIIATSPKFCIPSGVCPGDSVAAAFDILGPTEIIGGEAIYTSPAMGACSINLGLSGDIIDQIKLACP